MTKYYWMAVTDRRVLAVLMGKPGEVLFSGPRGSIQLADATPHSIYSTLSIQRTDGSVVKFRVHRMWREEYEALVAALRGAARPTFQV